MARGEGGGEAGGMPSRRLCLRPVLLFAALQLTTLLLLRKGGRAERDGEGERAEGWRIGEIKRASSCW